MSIVWLNGTLCDAAVARINPTDRGFTLGDGLFETLRAQDGAVQHTDRHFARLREGARILQIPLPLDEPAMRAALHDVLRANSLTEAALRLMLTRGPAARGVLPAGAVEPTILITAGPLPPLLSPARLIIAQHTRRNEFSPLSRIKSLNYLDSIIARQEAADAGADDALLLNTQGRIAEATTANFFLHLDGNWVTPPVSDGALPGIARALLLASDHVTERSITVSDLTRATASFLANSLGRRVVSKANDFAFDSDGSTDPEMEKILLF